MQLFNSPSPVIDGSAVPTAPAVAPTALDPAIVAPAAVAVNVAPVTADPSTAGLDVDTDVDPFILDEAMDTRPDISSPNVSFAYVPNPADFVIPSSPQVPYYCIIVGQPVGVIESLDTIDIANQERFEFHQFTTWFGAVGYYTVNYHRQQVLLIPSAIQGPAPTHTQRAAEATAPPIRTAGQGSSASLPSNVTPPLAAASVHNVAQGSTTAPSPARALVAPAAANVQSIAQGSMAAPVSENTSAPAAAAAVQPLSVSSALQIPPTQGASQTSPPAPALGSARNPIRLDSPSLLLRMLDSLDATCPVPDPNNHRNSAKGESSAQNQAPLHEKQRAKVSAATRIRRKGNETAKRRVIIVHDTESETDPEILAKRSSSSKATRKQEPAKPKVIVRGTDSDTDGLPSYPKPASGDPSSSSAAPTAATLPGGDVFSLSNQPQPSLAPRLPNVATDSDSDERYLAARAAIKRSKRAQPRRKNLKRSKTSSVYPPMGTTPADHSGPFTSTTTQPVTESPATSSRGQPTNPHPSGATHQPVSQPSILPTNLDIFSLQSPFNQIRGPGYRLPQTPTAAATSGTTSHNADSSPIPETSSLAPHPDEKRFVPLFSDLDDSNGDHDLDNRGEVSPWFAQWLRTNAGKRYRATPSARAAAVARRLFCDQPTADNSTSAVSSAIATASVDNNANAIAPAPATIDVNMIVPTPISTVNGNTIAPAIDVNTIAPSPVDVNTIANTIVPTPVDVDGNTTAPTPVDVDSNMTAPAPVDIDTSTIAPASVGVDGNTTEPAPVDVDANTIAPAPISADGSTIVSSTVDTSNPGNENDGRDSEVGSTDYGVSEIDSDFLDEIGPYLDAVYILPTVEDGPMAKDSASADE
ncbi:hypothetical protein BDN70DRAFT_998783 [Pholiota conissans]|uniref:Uncharacterized protein n=1 Tax=Pholiota conissans TaxID=109636 RepID=A0A9P5YLT4_9AGAR|nr:hypothetical protein BDN70DRAFT_998783 [Pholiota conissans]